MVAHMEQLLTQPHVAQTRPSRIELVRPASFHIAAQEHVQQWLAVRDERSP